MNGAHKYALRALRDCGVIRATARDVAYRALVDGGLAIAFIPEHQPNKRDFHLTEAGKAAAAKLRPIQ